mgnify:CR=1 FL=1
MPLYDRQSEVVGVLGVYDDITEQKREERRHALALDASKTVSYTHLRAHETVLDLVCRLLLEKKKNNITQTDRTTHKRHHTLAMIK